jgi:FtsH-binding integral membrane protein
MPQRKEDLKVTHIEGDLELRRSITVEVLNLDKWIEQNSDFEVSDLVLYVDGIAFNKLPPKLVEGTKLEFNFNLSLYPEIQKAWAELVSKKVTNTDFFERKGLSVTIGLKNGMQLHSTAEKQTLVRIKKIWLWGFVTVFGLGIFSFILLARNSDVIRDTGIAPSGSQANGLGKRKPYSLARTQMAFWFFVVVMGFVFIWMATDNLATLTPAVLGLIGISAATGLSSAVVDSGKRSDQQNQRRALEDQKKGFEVDGERLKGEITNLTGTSLDEKTAALAAKKKEIEQTDQKIGDLPDPDAPRESKGFYKDLLSDDAGVSFHRFQIFAWTIVLIIIFVASVFNNLAMPAFDGTLLALMGISGGTYIGFKLPEQPG